MALSKFRSSHNFVILKTPTPNGVRILTDEEDQIIPITNDLDLEKRLNELQEARIVSEDSMKQRMTF